MFKFCCFSRCTAGCAFSVLRVYCRAYVARRVSIDLLVVVCIAYIIRVLSLAAMGSDFA